MDQDQEQRNEFTQVIDKTRDDIKHKMGEIMFRCLRAAMMNYEIASFYDDRYYYVEMSSAIVGVVSAVSTCVGFTFRDAVKYVSTDSVRIFKSGGVTGLAAALGLHFIAAHSAKDWFPSLRERAQAHNDVAAGWQGLEQLTWLYYVRMNDPTVDPETYTGWYTKIIERREKLCKMSIVPESTYNKFDGKNFLLEKMKRRDELYKAYCDLRGLK